MNPLVDRYRLLSRPMKSILDELEAEIRPGRTTRELEQTAEDAIHRAGVNSCFLGYRGYPACITASVNEEVLNTLPSRRSLKEGDLLKLQVGIRDDLGFSYQAWTYFVGAATQDDARFIETGRIALNRAIGAVRTGHAVSNISRAIQETMEGSGYSVNKNYVGHGMGRYQHEEPQIPCHVHSDRTSPLIAASQILSVLVIAHRGREGCATLRDNWNVVTRDKSNALLLSQIVVARDGLAEVILEPRDSHLQGRNAPLT